MKTPNKKPQHDPIMKICEACVAYADGKMSLQQVWYRVRGYRILQLIQEHPEFELSAQLYTLSCDFFTWYEQRDDIIDRNIRSIAAYLKQQRSESALH